MKKLPKELSEETICNILNKVMDLGININYRRPWLVITYIRYNESKDTDVFDNLNSMITLSSYGRKCSIVHSTDSGYGIVVSLRSAMLKPNFTVNDLKGYFMRNRHVLRRVLRDIKEAGDS